MSLDLHRDEYINYAFDTHIFEFQNFYKTNLTGYKEGLFLLSKILSQNNYAILLRFLVIVLQLPLPSKDFLIKKTAVYNSAELKQLRDENKFLKQINTYYEKFNLEGWEKLEVNVFKYHCGLKEFKQNISSYVYKKVFVDVGAFFGDSALMLLKYSPTKILALEPNSINHANLEQTIRNNKLESLVYPIKKGLGDTNSIQNLNYISQKQNLGASFIFVPKYKQKTEKVFTITLDTLLTEQQIDSSNVGIIKIDAEGFGLKVLKGAEKVIRLAKPVISCAIYHNPEELFKIIPFLYNCNKDYNFHLRFLSHESILRELTVIAI